MAMANVSTWLRAFRPPLQRAYTPPDEPARDFAALLELADARRAKTAPRDGAKENPASP